MANIPSTEEFLSNLYRIRQDGLRILVDAKANGASAKDIRTSESLVQKVEKMIKLKGGSIDA